jgi:hypothetical protein
MSSRSGLTRASASRRPLDACHEPAMKLSVESSVAAEGWEVIEFWDTVPT